MYVHIYMDVCCMHSARTGYIYECVCTGYIYECIPRAHAHACIHARIHSYLGRLGSALSSERPPVLVLLRCFSSHPVLNRHLCVCVCVCHGVCVTVCVYVCEECNRDDHSEFLRPGMHAPSASCQRELILSTKSRQREEVRRPQAWTLEFGAWKACACACAAYDRGNGVIHRGIYQLQGDDNGHVGRPC